MLNSDNEWDEFVGLVSSDRAVLDVLLRGARKRHKLNHKCSPEASWQNAIREVVADAFSDDGVLGLLREKMRLLSPNGKSQRTMRTIGRHAPSFSTEKAAPAASEYGVVAATNRSLVTPDTQSSFRRKAESDEGSTNDEVARLERASEEPVEHKSTRVHNSCCCACGVEAGARCSRVLGYHRPPVLLSRTAIPLFSIDSPDFVTSFQNRSEGKLEGVNECAGRILNEDKGVDVGAKLLHQKVPAIGKAEDNGSSEQVECHITRRGHLTNDGESRESGERGDGQRGSVPPPSAKGGHHPVQHGGEDRELPSLHLGDSESRDLRNQTLGSGITCGGHPRLSEGGNAVPLLSGKENPPPFSSRVQHQEVDSSDNDPSCVMTAILSGAGTNTEGVKLVAATGSLPRANVTESSSLLGTGASSKGGIPSCSVGVLADDRMFEAEENVDLNATLCTSDPLLPSSSFQRRRSGGTTLNYDDNAAEFVGAQQDKRESMGEGGNQPSDGNAGISTAASLVLTDHPSLSDASGFSNSASSDEVAKGRGDEDPESKGTKAAAQAVGEEYDKEQRDTQENSAAEGALPSLRGHGTTIALSAGAHSPDTRSTSALQAQTYSSETISTDYENDGEYEFTFDEDDATPGGRKSVHFSDESLWKVHEVRASFEKHELAELFYTSTELDVMVEEAEKEETLELSKVRVSHEEREHQNGLSTLQGGRSWVSSDIMHNKGFGNVSCGGEDSDYEF